MQRYKIVYWLIVEAVTQNAHEKLFTKMLGSKSRDTLPYPVKLRSQKMLYIFNVFFNTL